MPAPEPHVITSPDDPRLEGMGQEQVAGADQMASRLAATPDERLDALVVTLEFVAEARAALRRAG